MPGSFLARHRTICEVLEEIRREAYEPDMTLERFNELIDEAKGYAQSMSNKLLEYKKAAMEPISQDPKTVDQVSGILLLRELDKKE